MKEIHSSLGVKNPKCVESIVKIDRFFDKMLKRIKNK